MGLAMFAVAREPFEGSTWRPNDSGLGILVLCAAIMGCGEQMAGSYESIRAKSISATPESSTGGMAAATPAMAPVAADQAKDAIPTVQPRKIIYNARVELVVEDLTTVVDDLTGLVKTHGGYVAETDVSGSAGGQRRGMWKVRVPVDRFDAFLGAVAKLGELQQNHVDSQDVTQVRRTRS